MPKHLSWQLSPSSSIIKNTSPCPLTIRAKLVSYGAFIQSPLTHNSNQLSTKEVFTAWLWSKIWQESYQHAWDSLMHYKMGLETKPKYKERFLFQYNDGLIPIFSSLYLKSTFYFKQKSLDKVDLKNIQQNNPKARLFANLDHSQLTATERIQVNDLLNQKSGLLNAMVLQDLESD